MDICAETRTITLSSKYFGYAPTVLLVALVIAVPLPRARRLRALAWGLSVVSAFVALRVGLMLADQFAAVDDPCRLYSLDPWQKQVLSGVARGIANSPPISFMVPVLIWAAVTFRRGDWALLSGFSDPDPPEQD